MRAGALVLLLVLGSCETSKPVLDLTRVYKIGTDGAFPFHALDKSGKPTGFAAEVLNAAARRAGVALEWNAFNKRAADAIAGDFDLWPLVSAEGGRLMPNSYISKPWMTNDFGVMIYVDDLHRKPVLPPLRSVSFREQPNSRRLAASNFPGAKLAAYPSRDEAMEAFCRGQVEGALMEMRIAQHLFADPPSVCVTRSPTLVGLRTSGEAMVLVGKREHRVVIDRLRAEIDSMAEDGELERLLAPWAFYQTGDIMSAFYRQQAERRYRMVAYLMGALAAVALIGVGQLVALRKTHRDRALAAANEASLRALSLRQSEILEEERARISREIHDELGQQLTVLKFGLNSLLRLSEKETPERIAELQEQADEAIRGMRRISSGLRPPILDQFGLFAAIEWLAEDFRKRTGIVTELDLPPETTGIEASLSTAIFRIVQESLTNIARHSSATRAVIRAEMTGKEIVLSIGDNGTGLAPEKPGMKPGGSLGILGMKERAAAMGGRLLIASPPEGGLRIDLKLPLARA